MCRAGGVDDFPIVLLEVCALLVGQTAVRVVQDQTGAQWRKGRVDVEWVQVAGDAHGSHGGMRQVATRPFATLAVCCEAAPDNQVE